MTGSQTIWMADSSVKLAESNLLKLKQYRVYINGLYSIYSLNISRRLWKNWFVQDQHHVIWNSHIADKGQARIVGVDCDEV